MSFPPTLENFCNGTASFLGDRPPSEVLRMPLVEQFKMLQSRLGETLFLQCLNPKNDVVGPVANEQDTDWLRRANVTGINVRTIQNFWNCVPYACTLPAAQNAIHLLPIWEPGVVSSLYGMVSFHINPEFYQPELARYFPHLSTVEAQLKVVVNLLHALGKSVGMDVIPHTDRYSEIVLENPMHFEWLRREENRIVRQDAALWKRAAEHIYDWLVANGPAVDQEIHGRNWETFFSTTVAEGERGVLLFGEKYDYDGRRNRRLDLLDYLTQRGYEPLPATMGPPYRGLEVDPDSRSEDDAGRIWYDYRMQTPMTPFSRVFGPLTRYRFYEPLDNNRDWQLNFKQPHLTAWEYFAEHYQRVRDEYHFDFMRGDMSHVQMRPDGVPTEVPTHYDPHRFVKEQVQKSVPYFGYLAESFLAEDDQMAYGNEVAHLNASAAEATLGNLQSMVPGSAEFNREFARYVRIHESARVLPTQTTMTADKDDPRFDEFYLHGNEARYLTALFLTDWPSYHALGFEQRDPHPEPVANELYTKLYVFQIPDGPKGTNGPWRWGANTDLFQNLLKIRELCDDIFESIRFARTHFLLLPDNEHHPGVVVWSQLEDPHFLFIANFNSETVDVDLPEVHGRWHECFRLSGETVDWQLEGATLKLRQLDRVLVFKAE